MGSHLFRLGMAVFLAATSSLVAGCSYQCHNYPPFTMEAAQDTWKIHGDVGRKTREDMPPPPGSLYHWRPDEQDRWWVELTPVAADTTFWSTGDVKVAELTIVADTDTIHRAWKDKIDLVAKAQEYTNADGTHRFHGLEFGKYEFESEFFHLPADAPEILKINCTLILIDLATGEEHLRLPLEMQAVLDRHRRWAIVDAAEM